ncbi:MAG: ATP synthase F1 subunit delta [Ruminococcus sp.]|nr:ATP synthase F1 subunit delta [Ruminococcus sp.]
MAESLKNVYAEAVFQLCCERGIEASAAEELEAVGSIFEDNEEFVKVLRSPLVSFDEKKQLLEKVFGGKVCDTVLDFLCLTVEKGRAGFIPQICEEYKQLWYKKQGILEVDVVTAMPMSSELSEKLKQKLEKTLDKKVIMKQSVDSTLIGGIIVRYEGAELDSSVRGRLDKLRSMIDGTIV